MLCTAAAHGHKPKPMRLCPLLQEAICVPCSGRWTPETSRADAGVQALPDFLALMHLMVLQLEQLGPLLDLVFQPQQAPPGEH